MTASCSQILGSGTRLFAVPNPNCAAAPFAHRIRLAVPLLVGDTTVSLVLDSTFTAGGYTATTLLPLYPGIILYLVDGVKVIPLLVQATNLPVNLSLTATLVSIPRSTESALVASAVISSYLAAKLCIMKADTTTSTTTQDNTTTCTGLLATKINTAFEDVLDISGFPNGKDRAFYDIMETIGREAGSIFFMKDYDRQEHESGVVQLTKPSRPGAQAKGLVSYTVQGQVQTYLSYFQGSIALSPAQLALAQDERRLWGAELAKA